jgi:SAM-dependent methyltransferase
MAFNQLNEDLNDAFETYFPRMNPAVRLPYGAATRALAWGMKARTRLFGGEVKVNERIVEYPQILRWMPDSGTVLDIGCVSSRLPIQLASMGYTVDGVDTRPYPFTHPNFTFYRSDLFTWSPPRAYDTICLVSVIEHFGLGGYGDMKVNDADREAITRITEWLVPGGTLLVSLPYGKAGVTTKHRIYDAARLSHVFGQLETVRSLYYQRKEGAWLPSTAAALADVASPDLPPNGVAVLHFRKPTV